MGTKRIPQLQSVDDAKVDGVQAKNLTLKLQDGTSVNVRNMVVKCPREPANLNNWFLSVIRGSSLRELKNDNRVDKISFNERGVNKKEPITRISNSERIEPYKEHADLGW